MAGDSLYIASVVFAYWFISISMVYLNKVLMSNESISIDAPLFIIWFQCVTTCFICWVAGKIGEMVAGGPVYSSVGTSEDSDGDDDKRKSSSFFAQFPKAEYNGSVAYEMLPLSIVFVNMIIMNNLCLKWVEVSFYQVARSFTIVYNVIFSVILLGQKTSRNVIFCLAIVCFGFYLGSAGEINMSIKGTIAGVLASAFVSLNSIFTKKYLAVVQDNHWRLAFYNNMNATFLFLPLIFFFERHTLYAEVSMKMQSGLFWAAMVAAGFFGFSIGIATVLQIKATSPITHNVSGTAKAALQSFMAFTIWKNPATVKGVCGILVVLGGSLMYTIVKMQENKQQEATQKEEVVEVTDIDEES